MGMVLFMLKEEIEQRAKENILVKINNLPQFTHPFFTDNELVSYSTKLNYYIIFIHFLNYIKDLYSIESITLIPPYVLENLSLDNIYFYRDNLLKEYSASTVNSKISSLKGIFQFFYYKGIINRNIMSQVINEITKTNKSPIQQQEIESFFQSISDKKNEFLRKRNLSIVSLIIDTGLSIQDVVELNISNVIDDKIVYEINQNIIQYILRQQTIIYMKQYMNIIDTKDINAPLYKSIQNERITNDAIKGIFKQYGNGINASNFQAKPSIKIKDTHNFILTIKPKNYNDEKEINTMEDRIKASDLFVKLVVNSQRSMKSEDQQLIKRIAENHGTIESDAEKILKDISMSNEYMRISIIKTTVTTLIELGIVEEDMDILNPNNSNQLVEKAMDIFEKAKQQ